MIVALIAVSVLAVAVAGLAGGFAALWVNERRLRQEMEGARHVDAVSDRYDAAYTRNEVARIYERAG